MHAIVSPAAPAVNPAAVVSTAATVNAFARWAAERVLVPAPLPLPETLDGEPGRYEPSVQDAWELTGYHLGLDGVLADVETVFPDASPRDHLVAAFNFHEGQHAGYRRYARRVGYDLGLDGKPDARPESIPSRFGAVFLLGHFEGARERREREREMAAYFRQLDLEREFEERERDLEMLAREAGGWDRVAGRALA